MSEKNLFLLEEKKYNIHIQEEKCFSIASLASLSMRLNYEGFCENDEPIGNYQANMKFNFKADLSKAKLLLKLARINVNAIEEGNFISNDIKSEFIKYNTDEFKMFKKTLSIINNSGSENVSINTQAKKILDSLKAEVKDFELQTKPIAISYNYDNNMTSGNMKTFNNLFSQFAKGKNASNTVIQKEELGMFEKYYDQNKENNFNHVIKLYENHQAILELILDVNLPIRFKFYGTWSEIND